MTPAEANQTRPSRRIEQLRRDALDCTACDLYKSGTQTVFGEGSERAEVMLVGEQPGDREDLAGRPFVGPAGNLLDRALDEAGLHRERLYVTNAVKHFKWKPQGKVRLHQKPSAREVAACKPWLEAEIDAIRPRTLVLLGATAAQAVLGPSFRVTKDHGQLIDLDGVTAMGTIHPSAILRARGEDARVESYQMLVADLAKVAALEAG